LKEVSNVYGCNYKLTYFITVIDLALVEHLLRVNQEIKYLSISSDLL
jgi:hypothetical protein